MPYIEKSEPINVPDWYTVAKAYSVSVQDLKAALAEETPQELSSPLLNPDEWTK